MCERAVSRESHGKLLAQHQMIQDFIALSHTEIEAARLLTFQTAWKMDKYGASAVRADISHGARPTCPGWCSTVLDRTIQVCGALGYSGDLPVEGWYRGTRFGTIGDGPDEVHKTVRGPHPAEELHAGRGLAHRAHPEPAPGGRGEVGRAAAAAGVA